MAPGCGYGDRSLQYSKGLVHIRLGRAARGVPSSSLGISAHRRDHRKDLEGYSSRR
jgi:hypothetical protein